MKTIDIDELDKLPGTVLRSGTPFSFRCYPGIGCFNQCCRNLNLFLYPYDVARLRRALGISSDDFLDRYADVVLRRENHFPEVLLRMADDDAKSCPFVTPAGCAVYADRPGTCRSFPVEDGMICDAENRLVETIHFFRPPEFCLGPREDTVWTPETCAGDPDALTYLEMTRKWAELKRLFDVRPGKDPWQGEGPEGRRAKMAFMAAYNLDRFREFVFDSSFLKRYKLKKSTQARIRLNDRDLLELAFQWIRFFLWSFQPIFFTTKREADARNQAYPFCDTFVNISQHIFLTNLNLFE